MPLQPIYETVEKNTEGLKKKVLVMDEEEIVRDVVALMLYKLGYDVSLSKDGDETIEQYKNSKISGEAFDAVILDLNVKVGMGGKEVCRRLLEINSSVKCVASGYPVDLAVMEFERHGFKASISKPYRLSFLDEVLKKVT
jgi:CheY-like chemotaxis protein